MDAFWQMLSISRPMAHEDVYIHITIMCPNSSYTQNPKVSNKTMEAAKTLEKSLRQYRSFVICTQSNTNCKYRDALK
jgi:hypothetical protein